MKKLEKLKLMNLEEVMPVINEIEAGYMIGGGGVLEYLSGIANGMYNVLTFPGRLAIAIGDAAGGDEIFDCLVNCSGNYNQALSNITDGRITNLIPSLNERRLFNAYINGTGETNQNLFTPDEKSRMLTYAKSQFDVSKATIVMIGGQQFYKQGITFYQDGGAEFGQSLGGVRAFYDLNGNAVGIADEYNFHKGESGSRSFPNEVLTMAVKILEDSHMVTGHEEFNIRIGITNE